MIYLFITLSAIVSTSLSFYYLNREEKNKEVSDKGSFWSVCAFTSILFLIIFSYSVISTVNKANAVKAKIQLMKPLDKYRQDIAITEMELAKVERLIDKAFDKNNPNVQVDIRNDVKIYSLLGSSDLGSAEAGNAEKQRLLLNYINKQNEIADRLIYVKKLAYGDEYYNLQQEYATYTSSIFSGWVVRIFALSDNYKPVINKEFYPYDSKQ